MLKSSTSNFAEEIDLIADTAGAFILGTADGTYIFERSFRTSTDDTEVCTSRLLRTCVQKSFGAPAAKRDL